VTDLLDRIEPVARELLRRVDAELVNHGAPDGHPIWDRLRRLGTTPADAVAFFAGADPQPLREAAAALRRQADLYAEAPVPTRVAWAGAAGEAYAAQAEALSGYAATMGERLLATASYVDSVADWYADARRRVAGALADAIGSAEAVTLTAGARAEAIQAAADLGAHVLAAADAAHEDGYGLLRRWAPALGELPYRPAEAGPARVDASIDLRH
jgi:uncharacterized protein YukE